MCFIVPLQAVKDKGGFWEMEDGRMVKVDLVKKVKKGDYLICQQDMAVKKISKKEALSVRKAIKKVSDELSERH